MSLLRRVAYMLSDQRKLIRYQSREIRELQRCLISHQHAMISMAENFRIALEMPEVDIRDDLDELIRELADGVAKLEEHVL